MEAFNGAANQQPYPDFTAAALEGVDAGQHMRAVSALQGIDINDPASLNRGYANLVRAGAAEQASALMGLQMKRGALEMGPKILEQLNALGQQGQQPPQQTQPDPQSQGADLNNEVVKDTALFKQTPPDQQPALAAQLKAKYLALHVPESRIDAVLAHAATPGGADQIAEVHGNHATLMNGGQLPPDAKMMHGGPLDWGSELLAHPALMAGMNYMKQFGGADYTPLITTAHEIAAPEIQAQATEAHAAPIAAETARGQQPYTKDTVSFNGQPIEVTGEQKLAILNNPALRAAGFGVGLSPGQEAEQRASGTVKGTAPGTIQTVNLPGNRTEQVTFTPNKDGTFTATPIKINDAGGTHSAVPTSSPGEVDRFTKSNQQYVADQQLVAGSNNRLTILKHVNDLLNDPHVGGTGPGTQAVNGWRSFLLAQAPGVFSKADLEKIQDQTAGQHELHKYMVQMAGNAAAQYGPGTNEKLAMAASGNANTDISTLANKDVTRLAIAMDRASQAKLYAFGKTGQSGDHYSDFSENWGRTVDPRAFMLDLMSKSERLKLADTIKTDPERRAFVAGKMAAEAAGIYTAADIRGRK